MNSTGTEQDGYLRFRVLHVVDVFCLHVGQSRWQSTRAWHVFKKKLSFFFLYSYGIDEKLKTIYTPPWDTSCDGTWIVTRRATVLRWHPRDERFDFILLLCYRIINTLLYIYVQTVRLALTMYTRVARKRARARTYYETVHRANRKHERKTTGSSRESLVSINNECTRARTREVLLYIYIKHKNNDSAQSTLLTS